MIDENKSIQEIAKFFERNIDGIRYAMRKNNIVQSSKILDLDNEIWKDINGYEGYYQVSNLGRVKSLPRWIYYSDGRKYFYDGVILSFNTDHGGYSTVVLTINTNLETKKVHRLVAEAFLPNPNNLPEVNHKDENKKNNQVSNLEWCNNDYNNHYGTRLERVQNILIETLGKPVVFTKIDTGEKFYYPAINIGIKELNLDPRAVQRCLKKEPYYKTVKGFSVEYVQ